MRVKQAACHIFLPIVDLAAAHLAWEMFKERARSGSVVGSGVVM